MKRTGLQVMTRLVGLVRPLTGYMVLAVLMGLVGHLCAAFLTVFSGFAVLRLLGLWDGLSIGAIFGCLAAFAMSRGVLRYAEQGCNHFIAFKLLALLRDKVFAALRRLTPAKLEGRQKGDLISLITSDIELLEVFYAHTISPVCIAVLFTVILVGFLSSIHWALGLLALTAYMTVGLVVPWLTAHFSGTGGMEFREQSGSLAGFVLDSLRGLPEILQYDCGKARLAEMDARTDSLSSVEKSMKNIGGWSTALTNGILMLFDLAMLLLSSKLCGFGGALTASLTMMASFGPALALAALGSTLQQTFAAGNRVLDLLEEEPLVEEVTGQAPVAFSGAAAEQITFTYENEPVLQDFSLQIPENHIIGIVGRSGSGKSTLLKLLMRFWRVREGRITISDRNVEQINTANLRNLESYVTQQTYLFHDSIRSNLKVAKQDATDAELIAACKKASVHDFILTLPQGYDTPVGELGETLSGGERQRLGLARAFLHDAPFLLLDEPTSNLDSLNEAVILKSLHQSRAGKTVVLVSHRRSTVGIADQVIEVEQGRKC